MIEFARMCGLSRTAKIRCVPRESPVLVECHPGPVWIPRFRQIRIRSRSYDSGASGNARFASRSKWPWRASAACGTRSTRLRNKRNRSVGRCPCAWVRKRCYELTESPRSSETVPARSQVISGGRFQWRNRPTRGV